MRIASLQNAPAVRTTAPLSPLPSPRSTPLGATAASLGTNSDFEGARRYVLNQFDDAVGQLNTSIELLSEPIPPGPIGYASKTYQHIDNAIGAVNGATSAAQEGLLWYGDMRANATLPANLAAKERAVLAHVYTGLSGVTRADGFMRGMLELGQAPLNDGPWRDQAVTDALDSVTFLSEARALVEAMQPRAQG